MNRLYTLIISSALILACGMSVPINQQLGVKSGNVAIYITTTAQPVPDLPSETLEIGIVTTDVLTVRACPAEECMALYYLYRDTPVMGTCYRFSDGSIWLGLDESTKYIAVLFDGSRYVEGVCK